MQLVLGLGGAWKCVDVQLEEGCLPCIGGHTLSDVHIEPALWFKVLVLDCISVDCSDRIISWTVCDHQRNESPDSVHSPPLSTRSSSLCDRVRVHSLMAPHEGNTVSMCTDELASLFELAEVLIQAGAYNKPRGQTVELKTWIRLVHCYLLPLVTFSIDDLPSLQAAQSDHGSSIAGLDKTVSETSTQNMQLKESLSALRSSILPVVKEWAELKQCSQAFLDLLTSDLCVIEEQARSKIQSSVMNLDLSDRLTTPLSGGLKSKFADECSASEQLLLDTLLLRSSLSVATAVEERLQGEPLNKQEEYIKIHADLRHTRHTLSTYSNRKVLALSVREALDLAVKSVESVGTTIGLDLGVSGGHSTDVLTQSKTEYETLKEKLQKVLSETDGPISLSHATFCSTLKQEWFPDISDGFVLVQRSQTLSLTKRNSPEVLRRFSVRQKKKTIKQKPNIQQMAISVKDHFQKMMDLLCHYYNNHDEDFVHRMWLCYEQVFFGMFAKDFTAFYESTQEKYCECLKLNALSASLLPTEALQLDIPCIDSSRVFPPRPFDLVTQLYKEITTDVSQSPWQHMCSRDFTKHFGGMTFDLQSLSIVHAPLEKLQLLTSAFRKCMSSLSRLKLAPLSGEGDCVDASQAAVSCDDLLPVLVMVLLHVHPRLLVTIHINTTFLNDYIAPFLTSGWHGYSLATFTSALHVISKL